MYQWHLPPKIDPSVVLSGAPARWKADSTNSCRSKLGASCDIFFDATEPQTWNIHIWFGMYRKINI